MKTKPEKPSPDFPLFPHASGQWAKTIRGKQVYFGVWADPTAAYERYQKQYPPDGQAARASQCTTLAKVLNTFRNSKMADRERGSLTARSFRDYEAVCDTIAATIDRHRPIDSLDVEDFELIQKVLMRGKNKKQLVPSSQKRRLTIARMIFKFANEVMRANLVYKKSLKPPSAKALRKARNEVGERLFTPAEIQALIKEARPQLKAMIYLGINCGFGNRDCATLPINKVDIPGGWHHYQRPKTEIARRCPLWPETAAAIYAVLKERTEGLVFMTRTGQPWFNENGGCPISYEFRKLVTKLDFRRCGVTTFYSLRRTFETIGAVTGEQLAVDHIMGHVPATSDMSAVYRQKTFDAPLLKVTDHVRNWLLGSITIV